MRRFGFDLFQMGDVREFVPEIHDAKVGALNSKLNQDLNLLEFEPIFERKSKQVEEKTGESGIFLSNMDELLQWANASSLWPLSFGLACCAIEMMGTYASSFDLDRLGVLPRASPRQADVLIISGTVTFKMADRIKRLYEQMPDPKYVISMGSCSNCGGPYWEHGYHVVKGVDRIIPVDVYVPGCPPRPEALIGGILKLQEKITKKLKAEAERPLDIWNRQKDGE